MDAGSSGGIRMIPGPIDFAAWLSFTVGAAFLVGSSFVHHWERTRVQTHAERMGSAIMNGDPMDQQRTAVKYRNDRKLDWAMGAMFVCHVFGILAIMVGALLWVLG